MADFPDIEDILKERAEYKNVLDKNTGKKVMDDFFDMKISTREEFEEFKKIQWKKLKLDKGFRASNLISIYRDLIKEGIYEFDPKVIETMSTKNVRRKYGVMVLAQTLSPYPEIDLAGKPKKYMELRNQDGEKGGKFTCAWNCTFCPSRPGMPKSYDEREDGIRRGMMSFFDPVIMTNDRLKQYLVNGMPPKKLEIIYLGGTFESFFGKKRDGEEYVEWFTRMTFYACNTFYNSNPREPLSLEEERYLNRYAKVTAIGLTIETRPDQVVKSLPLYRKLGCTRIQLGIQHHGTEYSDAILNRVQRGCTTKENEDAMKCLLRCGYKIDIHEMDDLPKPYLDGKVKKNPIFEDVNWELDMLLVDLEMHWASTYNQNYRYDQIKRYPCQVTDYSILKDEFDNGLHVPYGDIYYTADELEKMYCFSEYPIISDWPSIQKKEYIDKETYIKNFFSFMHEFIIKETQYWDEKKKSRKYKAKENDGKFNTLYILLIY